MGTIGKSWLTAQLSGSEWKIEQYHLTIPIPNELAAEVVERIRESQGSG